jgi:Big-like domain-containing protein/glycosyl hydrolase family 16
MRLHPLVLKNSPATVAGLLITLSLCASQASIAQAADTTAPAASWKSPAAAGTVSGLLWESANSGPSGACEATATDKVGVSRIVFYVDATRLNTENVAPYNCKFDSKTVADGSHVLKAVASDAAGNTTTSLRTVTVKNDVTAPVVGWKTPAVGARVAGVLWESANSGLSGPCEATATDNVAVSRIVYYIDATALNTENVAPYNCKLDSKTVADGSHTLKAVAYDAAGNSSTSSRTVTVTNDVTAPAVGWKTPAAGATVAGMLWDAANSGPAGPCEATATDDVAVSKVVYSVDATTLNTDDSAPYNCKLDTTTVADGSHTLTAVAYDAAGNTATSSRTVDVHNAPPPPPVDTTPPAVSWAKPAQSATVSGTMWEPANSGPSGPCEVAATDAVGVSKVMIYLDGTLLNQEETGPYNCKFDTNTVSNGTHTLNAVAYDATGNTSSAQRSVNVQNAAPPPVGGPGTVVFQDDFSGAAVNTNDWSFYTSPGSHAARPGLRKPEAFTQENGLLVVTAKWDASLQRIITGGMRHRKDYQYGSFEFRVRTEVDPTAQLSGVVLTWPLSNHKIPDGENDIYETGHSSSRNPFSTYIHYSTDGRTDRQVRFAHDADASQWHIMRMDWTRSSIKIYRDGALISTLTDLAAIPDVPHHMSIQLDGFSERPLPAPVKMYVDWVKIYQ